MQVHKDSFSLAIPYAKWNVHEITALIYVCPSESNSASHKHYGLWLMKSGIKKNSYAVVTHVMHLSHE